MIRARTLAPLVLAASLLGAAEARAQGALPDSLVYALDTPPSEFEWGCFAPCMCPILVQSTLTGSFILRRSTVGPLYTDYDVLDVRWKAKNATQPVTITGSGTYRRGGEVVLRDQLTLDLSFDGGPIQHFDSGLQIPDAPFPILDTRISLHGEFCHDSVLVVGARPLGVASVTGQPTVSRLSAAPNPFSGATAISFTLPRDAVVNLGVYDVSGRELRALAVHERLTAGAHARGWNGRVESGAAAPPGLYLVRLDTPAGGSTRTVVRLR